MSTTNYDILYATSIDSPNLSASGTAEAAQYDLNSTEAGFQRSWDGRTTGTGTWMAAHAQPIFTNRIILAAADTLVFFTTNGTSTGNTLFGTTTVPQILLSIFADDAVGNVSTALACWCTPASFATTSTSYITLNAAVITSSVAAINASASISIMAWGKAP